MSAADPFLPLEPLGQSSGILRLVAEEVHLDAILEGGQLTALRVGLLVKAPALFPLLLLTWAQAASARLESRVESEHRATPQGGLSLSLALEQARALNTDLGQMPRLPLEHDLFTPLRDAEGLSVPLAALWTCLRGPLEAGQSVGEMARSSGLPLWTVRFGLARLRQEKVVQKLTPTLDFDFNFG